MTLVRNLLQPLSGNRIARLIAIIYFLFFYADVHASGKSFSIALVMPFNFQNLKDEQLIDQKSFEYSNLAIDYYRGFKLAADSLSKSGVSYKIKLFDTQTDSNLIKTLAQDPFLLTADFIIGPFAPSDIQILLKANPKLKGKVISPISPLPIPGNSKGGVTMANNSLENHAENMAKYFAESKLSSNILIVRNGLLAETRYSRTFEKALDSFKVKITKKEILTAQKGYGVIEANLSKSKENYLLIPSADQAYAINLFKYLEGLNNEYPITLLVHPKWYDYQTIDPTLFIKYKVVFTSSYYVNYDDPQVMNYVNLYRVKYFTEPTEMSFRGFDQLKFFSSFYIDGAGYKANDVQYGLSSIFSFPHYKVDRANKSVFILKYTEEGLSKLQ